MAATGKEVVTISQLKTSIDSIDTSSSSIDAYPVGSIYMSVNSTSPATLFGGSWNRIQDRFLIAAGSTYKAGGTGGKATHKLTVNEMPSHTHSATTGYETSPTEGKVFASGSTVHGRNSATTDMAGGNQPHNNMPPYLSVYVWKRTA